MDCDPFLDFELFIEFERPAWADVFWEVNL